MTELLNTLYIQTQGAALFLDHDAVRVTAPDRPGHQALPLRRLNSIIAYGHVSICPDLLRRCAEDGRDVIWMSRSGRFVARVDGPVQGNVLLRHAQHLAYADPMRRLAIARCCVAGKIHNSRQMLLRSARDVTPERQTELRRIADDWQSSALRCLTSPKSTSSLEQKATRRACTTKASPCYCARPKAFRPSPCEPGDRRPTR